MQYFAETDDNLERIGKVIGDAVSVFIVLVLILVFAQSMIFR
jgi:hypothetical protein